MTCLRCRAEKSPGRRFCDECGAPPAVPYGLCGFSNEPGIHMDYTAVGQTTHLAARVEIFTAYQQAHVLRRHLGKLPTHDDMLTLPD